MQTAPATAAPVVRYVLTQAPDAEGLRTLADPAQGRYTYATPEDAAARLAAIMANNPPDVLASVYRLPLQVQAVECYPGHFDPMRTVWPAYRLPDARTYHDEWAPKERRDFTPSARQLVIIEAVRGALAAGCFYSSDVLKHCAASLSVSAADLAAQTPNFRTEGGLFGMDCYHARGYLRARDLHAAEDAAAAELAAHVGQKLGPLIFSDFKLVRAATVETVSDGGRLLTFTGKRGTVPVHGETTALQIKHARQRAAERAARRAARTA